ncbi:MAG TPA: sugar nucleotide-binding protein [Anaeromyxobacter sp.]
MKTVSIVGASGLVGGRLFRRLRGAAGGRLAATGTCFRSLPGPGMAALDVTDRVALAAHLAQGFDFVLYAAGTKDLRRCEEDFAFARALNATPVEEIVRIVERERLPTRVVYLSTDYVFDGERGLYREDDPVRPRTAYGRSKALGERAVLGAGERHKVIRSAAVMARGASFFDWLLRELGSDREVPLYDDCSFSPTPAELLCEMVEELVCAYDEVPQRIVHAVGERRLSRHALGRLVAAMVPAARAKLVPAKRGAGGPLFQADLSLAPSEFVRSRQKRSFEAYLADEVGTALAEPQ